jgi:hypothetical protein
LEADRPAEALACVDAVLPDHEKAVRAEQERVKAAAKEKREEEIPLVPFAAYQNLLRSFLREAPLVSDMSLQRRWAMLLARRGAALARLERDVEAAEAIRQAVAIAGGIVFADLLFPRPAAPLASLWGALPTLLWQPEPCALYDLARHLALASTLPRSKGRPDPADQAMGFLHCSLAAGFDNLHQIRTDSILEPLRKREDFRKLVHDLEARSLKRIDGTLNP